MPVGQRYPVNLLLTYELGGCDYSTDQIRKKSEFKLFPCPVIVGHAIGHC